MDAFTSSARCIQEIQFADDFSFNRSMPVKFLAFYDELFRAEYFDCLLGGLFAVFGGSIARGSLLGAHDFLFPRGIATTLSTALPLTTPCTCCVQRVSAACF